MSAPQVAIIADDLTGAADAGAPFARAGLLTLIALAPEAILPADVLVLSTESRHLAAEAAADRVRRAAERVKSVRWIYKKMDSTLRGSPGPELAAAMAGLGLDRALVAPAFPAQGRTTVDGRQCVGGVPVEQILSGREVRGSGLVALFAGQGATARSLALGTVRQGTEAIRRALEASGRGVLVADAETDADLDALARAAVACRLRLCCGSAGLAHALGRALPAAPATAPPAVPAPPRGPALAVTGSRHPRTLAQVETARRAGVAVIPPDPALLAGADAGVAATVGVLARHLEAGRDAVLATGGLEDAAVDGPTLAAGLAQVAAALAARRMVGGLVVTGGDVAAAACAALEAAALWVRDEVEPGIPWGVLVGGRCPGLRLVTKAGGFGSDEALLAGLRCLARQP
jgi:4-hydroxythreonine-4-phosphate dehydrogenase